MKTMTIILSFALMIALYFLFNETNNDNSALIKQVIDTVIIEKSAKPIMITNSKPKLTFVRDTIIKTFPFVAKIDTIIQRDTIKIEYFYPENKMNFQLFPKPDSTEIHTIYLTKEVETKAEWWEMPTYILGGIGLGFILGKVGE